MIVGVGPVVTAAGGRAPSDPIYDPFWARVERGRASRVGLHGGDSAYSRYLEHWGESAEMEAFRAEPAALAALARPDPRHDRRRCSPTGSSCASRTSASRRSSSAASGSFHLRKKLKKSFGQTPFLYEEDPVETLRRHVWVSPYYEDDLAALRELVGADRILMGSDWPHAEGLANPTDYIVDLRRTGYSAEDAEKIMRTNGLQLAQRQSVAVS